HHDAEHRRRAGRQRPGHHVRRVAELPSGLEDRVPAGLADVRRPPHDQGHQRARHPRPRSHVLHRRPACHRAPPSALLPPGVAALTPGFTLRAKRYNMRVPSLLERSNRTPEVTRKVLRGHMDIGVAGVGRIGEMHATHLAELDGREAPDKILLFDPVPERAEAVADSLPEHVTAVASFDELLAADGVVIATPTD